MTDDLVKRARDAHQDSSERTHKIPLIIEMADRIEALTAEHNATLARLAGAVAREIALTAERDNALNHLDSERYSVEVLEKRVAKFMADNARLREALQFYADASWSSLDDDLGNNGRPGVKARAALTGKEVMP